jgi:diguanylate cyclase (GGDEF)-like protein
VTTTDNPAERVRLEKFRQLQSMLPQSIGIGIPLALLVVAMMWRIRQPAMLLSWLAAQWLLAWWRMALLRQFARAQLVGTAAALRVTTAIRAGCLASGVLWGLIALFPYASPDLQMPLFIAFVLAGVTAAGASAMAAELVSALSFQGGVFVSLATRLLFIESDATYIGMGLTAILYMFFMALWTTRVYRNAVAGILERLTAGQREQLLQQRESRFRELAHHDALTGLPNRLSLQARMTELLERAATGSNNVAIIYIDIDHFKDINDSRGHRCGDVLLATAASRLRECVRPADLVVRMGGDEFIVVAIDAQQNGHIAALADRLAASFGQPLQYEGEAVEATVSMGIAVYPEHGTDADQLLRNADIALYQAKAVGRNNFQFFAAAMSVAFDERIFYEQALAKAIGTEQMYLEYQPLVDLRTGSLIGLEALLRWHHPERGLVPPLTFIPIAEHCGLIDSLGAEVLQMLCRQLREWKRAAVPLLPVALNVSPRQFERRGLDELLLTAAREHQVDLDHLQIEITETALMKGTAQESITLGKLRALGIKVMIDDFGIGYSSLNHLKNLAIDGLKIDRSFVRDMIEDERDAAIVAAVIGIANNLRIGVLAEGVESLRHVERLRTLGCDTGQGNFLHPPVGADACRQLLQQAARGDPVFRLGASRT